MHVAKSTPAVAANFARLQYLRLGLCGVLASSVAACAPPEEPSANAGQSTVSTVNEPYRIVGAISYRERMALNPDSTIRVILEDVSIADRAADVLTEHRSTAGGRQVPIDFALTVAPERFQPGRRYAVRAAINDPDGRLAWTTDTAHLIDPAQQEQDLGVLQMVRAGGGPTTVSGQTLPSADVQDREWVVTALNGAAVLDDSRVTLNFAADGRLWGEAGCNNYTTSYELADGALSLGVTAVTNRACLPALMDQETAFLRLLESAARVQITDDGALRIEAVDGGVIRAQAG